MCKLTYKVLISLIFLASISIVHAEYESVYEDQPSDQGNYDNYTKDEPLNSYQDQSNDSSQSNFPDTSNYQNDYEDRNTDSYTSYENNESSNWGASTDTVEEQSNRPDIWGDQSTSDNSNY
jgi:hypothetical protein